MDNDISIDKLKGAARQTRDAVEKKSNKSKLYNFLGLLSGKNLKIIILIIVLLVIVVLYFAVGNKSSIETDNKTYTSTYTSTLDYCAELESKLERVLSNIKGVGDVKVMVSVDGSPELKYASDTDTKTSSTSNGTTTTSSSSPIIISGGDGSNPLILTEELPKVKGVIVVASGASQIGIKLDILNAVSNLLDISTDKVSVLEGN